MENCYLPKPHKIIAINEVTPDEWNFRVAFDNLDDINYGQFLQVSLPKVGEAPISITDFDKKNGWLEFLIRKVGKVTNAVFELTEDDSIFLRGPYGNGFPFDTTYKNKHLIIVAGGSGCGPVRSMINAVHHNFKSVDKLDLIFGFKDSSCILFRDEIKEWKTSSNLILTVDQLSDEDSENEIEEGLVTEHISKLDFSDKENIEVVIVGPPTMMKLSAIEFEKQGLNDEQIWLSFERKMSCAVGKCGHCKIDETYVCLEGPVFNYKTGKKLID